MLLSKDGKTLVWVQPKLAKLNIPNGIKTIGTDAFTYSYVTEISIPKSVTSIKNCAFNSSKIKKITVSSSNTRYGKSGNCIYSKKTHHLVVGICTDGTLTLPSKVHYLVNNVSIAGKYVEKLILSSSFKGFKEHWYDNTKYTGVNIYLKTKTPPAAEKGSFDSFSYFVPKGSLDAYTQWYEDIEGEDSDSFFPARFEEY